MEVSKDEESPANCHFSLYWVSWNLVDVEKSPSLGELSTSSRPFGAIRVSSTVFENSTLGIDKLITSPSV